MRATTRLERAGDSQFTRRVAVCVSRSGLLGTWAPPAHKAKNTAARIRTDYASHGALTLSIPNSYRTVAYFTPTLANMRGSPTSVSGVWMPEGRHRPVQLLAHDMRCPLAHDATDRKSETYCTDSHSRHRISSGLFARTLCMRLHELLAHDMRCP